MMYDFVYILKQSEYNPELKYSLRTIERYFKDAKVIVVGYKPTWLRNVEYIHTPQRSSKWKNSTSNVLEACHSDKISDEFILMNDDFFCFKHIEDFKKELHVCMGKVQNRINYINKNVLKPDVWQRAFFYNQRLLRDLGCNTEYDFEIHSPIIINKQKFLDMMDNPIIKEFTSTDKILFKRTIYKNLYINDFPFEPRVEVDYKIKKDKDIDIPVIPMHSDALYTRPWISVYDHVVDHKDKFPILCNFLELNFGKKSKYEI